MSEFGSKPSEKEWTLYVCPECGSHAAPENAAGAKSCIHGVPGRTLGGLPALNVTHTVARERVRVAPAEDFEDEIESLKVQGHAAANLLRRRTEELDTLREWCRERGYLPDDLPRPKSFDRELHDRLAPLRRDRSGSSGRPEKETG